MIFSKLGRDNLPLWWLIFKGEKTVTRRPPPCLYCKKKWWKHAKPFDPDAEKFCLDKRGFAHPTKHYTPDLSRWQPIEHAKCQGSGGIGYGVIVPRCDDCEGSGKIQREIAIQPARTKAAICKNCGGWKEWHGALYANNIRKRLKVPNVGDTPGVVINWTVFSLRPKTYRFLSQSYDKHEICSNYIPLKVKIKSVVMAYDWLHEMKGKALDSAAEKARAEKLPYGHGALLRYADEFRLEGLEKEATLEGFSSWADLKEALSMYPKGTPLARLELSR